MQVFGEFTREAAAADADKAGGRANYLSKLPVGTTVLRALPPAVGRERPWVIVHQHFIRIPGADSPIAFNCPEKMANQACPACEQMRRLEKTGNPVDFEAAKSYAPQFRVFMNVIDRRHPERGPLLWGFGAVIFKRLTHFRENEDVCGEDFTHPLHGFDIIVTRTGTGKTDTRYQVDLSRKSTPLANSQEQMVEWGNAMADLTKSEFVPTFKDILERVNKAKGESLKRAPAGTPMDAAAQPASVAAAPPERTATDVAASLPDGEDILPF